MPLGVGGAKYLLFRGRSVDHRSLDRFPRAHGMKRAFRRRRNEFDPTYILEHDNIIELRRYITI